MPSDAQDPVTEGKHAAYHTSAYATAGAAMMSFQPINQIHQHLCAFHIYSDDPTRAVRSHHFCTHLRHDLHQCVVYDSDGPGARLIGVEYVVPESTFVDLPEDEKKYWHSHKYEVQSGQLILGTKSLVPTTDLAAGTVREGPADPPDAVSDVAEQPAMMELHRSYGKTIHTWQFDIHPDLPLGPPASMMSWTADEQVDWDKVKQRDDDMGVSTTAKREARAGYLKKQDMERDVEEGCDVWLKGRKGKWVWVEDE